MRHRGVRRKGMAAAVGMMLLTTPALGQYREYYVHGRVLDAQKSPLSGVEIRLVDASTSRSFHMKTDDKGDPEGKRAKEVAPGALGLLGSLLDDEGDGLDAGDLADAGKKFLGGLMRGRK